MDEEKIEENVYMVRAKCSNCGKEFFDLKISKGTVVGQRECPNCGCKTITRVVTISKY